MKMEMWDHYINNDRVIVHQELPEGEARNLFQLQVGNDDKSDLFKLLINSQKTHYLLMQALPKLRNMNALAKTEVVDSYVKKISRLVRRIERHLKTTGINWDETEAPINIEAIQRDQSEDNHKHDYDGDYPQSVCKICGVMRGDRTSHTITMDALETGEADES